MRLLLTGLQEAAAPTRDDQARLLLGLEDYENIQHQFSENQTLSDANTAGNVSSKKAPSLVPPEVPSRVEKKEHPQDTVEATGLTKIGDIVQKDDYPPGMPKILLYWQTRLRDAAPPPHHFASVIPSSRYRSKQ